MKEVAEQNAGLTIRRSGERVELQFHSDPAFLRPVRLELEEFGRNAGLSSEQADQIGLVLNEALANVMRHGYGGAKDKPIRVTFDRQGAESQTQVRVEIRDWAKPFDPAKLPTAPPPTDVEQIKPGGLGLHCMRMCMDQVTFTPQPDGMLLTMVKKTGTMADDKTAAKAPGS
jgi:serine/threonine-protein kinase RsbW